MIDKWASVSGDRAAITEFWEWVMENAEGSSWCSPNTFIDKISLLDLHLEKAMDAFQGINQKQLDKERRELLQSVERPREGK